MKKQLSCKENGNPCFPTILLKNGEIHSRISPFHQFIFSRHSSIMNIQFFLPAYLTGHSTTIEDVSTSIVVDTHGSCV